MNKLPLKVLVMLTLVCLNGCDSPLEYTGQQCSPAFVYVDPEKTKIDSDKSLCLVRQYHFSVESVGPIDGTTKELPLHYCDRCVGFSDYASVQSYWESVRVKLSEDGQSFINEAGYHD